MTTYYNQKLVHINKSNYKSNYLLVGNDEIAYASVLLKYGTFKVYLSLAGNVDGFDIGLSRAHIMNAYKISERTYKYAVKELEECGYLVPREDGTYDFYVTPYGKTLGELKGGAIDCTRVVQQTAPEGCNALPEGGATECPTNSSLIVEDSSYNNSLTSSATTADADTTTNTTKDKNKKKMYENVDEAEFVKSLSVDDFNKVSNLLSPKWLDYSKLHSVFHNDFNVHISDFKVLKEELSKQGETIRQKSYDDAQTQLYTLQNLPLEDIRDVLSSSGIDLSKDYDIGYLFQGEEPEVRQQLKDRFNLSILFTDCEGEFCLRLMEYAQSGDKDKFIENTKYWDTVKARR